MEKPYKYAKHIWPHDMRVHEQMTGETRLEIAEKHWFKFELVESPPGAVSNRIDIARNLFSNMWFDSKNCFSWISKLKNYKRKRNESTWTFIDQVDKNWSQHSADSFGYWCQYISETLIPKMWKSNHEEEAIKMFPGLRG